MRLEPFSETVPPGGRELLTALGAGETGFGGTSFGCGQCTLEQFLRDCVDDSIPEKVKPGLVQQITCWLMDDAAEAVGMVRIRPQLNDRLLQHGGNIGYFIAPAQRGRGLAGRALHLALLYLRGLGLNRALLTASPTNARSIRTILGSGGVQEGQGVHHDTGDVVNRYWIDLKTAP